MLSIVGVTAIVTPERLLDSILVFSYGGQDIPPLVPRSLVGPQGNGALVLVLFILHPLDFIKVERHRLVCQAEYGGAAGRHTGTGGFSIPSEGPVIGAKDVLFDTLSIEALHEELAALATANDEAKQLRSCMRMAGFPDLRATGE